MKIALAQINCHIGNIDFNSKAILNFIERARSESAALIVFPEMAICGYPPLDLLESEDFVDLCISRIELIAKQCSGITAIIGGPSRNSSIKGKHLFNSAYVLEDGKVKDVVHKTLLPTYDVFDEYRYFEPNRTFNLIEAAGIKAAVTICEDLWNMEDDPMYADSPMDHLSKWSPELIINIAASPFDYSHREKRISIISRNAKAFNLPVLYVNHSGAQTDLIFDGGSMIMNPKGEIIQECDYFREELTIHDLQLNKPTKAAAVSKAGNKMARIHSALVMGIRDYFIKMNFSDAILGLSGGVDSALVCVLACEALGEKHVHPIMMPSEFSSSHSVSDSLQLALNLGIDAEMVRVNDMYEAFLKNLSDKFLGKPFDITEENIQSRIRGTILMALSNKHRRVLLNTSNKSELAVGYGTLYGDMAGGLSVIGDLYKTEVYDLCYHINSGSEIIPSNILTKAPSAELRPGQKDSDSLPEYDILDRILFSHIEQRKSIRQITESGFDQSIVERVIRLVAASEYKRFQFAPILRVSEKAFGTGRRMPIVAKYL